MNSLTSPSLSFFKIIFYEQPNIYDIHTERRWGFEICRAFMDSIVLKQQIYCSFLRIGGGCKGKKKLVIFCGHHNYMISDVKKVTFLALVPVLQWYSHPHFLVYVRSKWKVTQNIFNLQEWQQNAQLQIFIPANITVGKN